MSALIGSLRVNLGIDSAQFSSGLKKAKSDLSGFSAGLKSFGAGLLAAFSVGSITAALRSTINHLDDVGKAAQKTGTSTEGFSKLEYSAKLAEVGTEQLTASLGKLTITMGEIAGGKGGDAKLAFDALGISVVNADGKLKDTAVVFSEIAQKFSVLKDGAAKNTLAFKIFGKSYADIIPLLNGGAAELKANGEELQRLGGVVTPQAAKAAEDFNDNLSRLQVAVQGLLTQAIIPILPQLVQLTEYFVGLANTQGAVEGIGFIEGAIRALQDVTFETLAYAGPFEAFKKMLSAPTGHAFLKEAKEVGAAWKKANAEIETYHSRQKANKNIPLAISAEGKSNLPLQKLDAPLCDFGAAAAARSLAALRSEEESAQRRLAAQELLDITQANNELASAAKSVFDQTRTPLETYNATIAESSRLLKLHLIDQDTFNRSKIQAAESLRQANMALVEDTKEVENQISIFQGFGDQLKNTGGSWFDSAIEGTFKFKTALKDLAKSLAKLAFNNLLTGLSGGMFGGSHPLYGGGISKLFGFAKGGTIMPGGSGGIDSQLVSFRKSPNERVDISKPGQGVGSGGNAKISFQVINNAGAHIQTRETTNANGERVLQAIVSRTVDEKMKTEYGLRRPTKLRQ